MKKSARFFPEFNKHSLKSGAADILISGVDDVLLFAYFLLFVFGGLVYGLIEVLFRGYTHWSMLIAGGVCFILIYIVNACVDAPKWQKWIMGGAIITAVEFAAGCIVNLRLGWNVWDYSAHRFNLMGQICLLFSVLWVGLSVPAVECCDFARKLITSVLKK